MLPFRFMINNLKNLDEIRIEVWKWIISHLQTPHHFIKPLIQLISTIDNPVVVIT